MSILNDLYYGNISPWDKSIGSNSEYYKQNQRIFELQDMLTATLNDNENKLFTEVMELEARLCALCEEERYIDGFCTGVKLILESLNHKSTNFK